MRTNCLLSVVLLYSCVVEQHADKLDDLTRYRYNPEPALASSAKQALDVLKSASGLPLEITGVGATSIRTAPADSLIACDESGKNCGPSCAQTLVAMAEDYTLVTGVEILVAWPHPKYCMTLDRTIMHEVMHSIIRNTGRNTIHASSGVFQPVANVEDFLLNEDSLLVLCEHAPCSVFEPEM